MEKKVEADYHRKAQTSVTNFLYCGDEYLFMKRNLDKRVDPGRLNGIGGRLEGGEDYLTAAIRETEEESGYIVKPEDITLSGIVKLEGGYDEDWIMAFFKIQVPNKNIPIGKQSKDGELMWIHKDDVLNSEVELVDDLYYCFEDIVLGTHQFFMTASVNIDQKIVSSSIAKIKL